MYVVVLLYIYVHRTKKGHQEGDDILLHYYYIASNSNEIESGTMCIK